MRLLFAILILATGCSREPGAQEEELGATSTGAGCVRHSDCGPTEWCLSQQCVPRPGGDSGTTTRAPLASLRATPVNLNFGAVVVGESRTLALLLENIGEVVVTLNEIEFAPAVTPFLVEPLGYGPFWIRPGRSREIFITYSPPIDGRHQAQIVINSEAPAVTVQLQGS